MLKESLTLSDLAPFEKTFRSGCDRPANFRPNLVTSNFSSPQQRKYGVFHHKTGHQNLTETARTLSSFLKCGLVFHGC